MSALLAFDVKPILDPEPQVSRHFDHPAALDAHLGEEVAVSPWLRIDQTRIDRFAEATGDWQWIHVDSARAANGPYGGTIAHGYLTLSLLPMLMDQALTLTRTRMGVNYGLNKLRFPAPVPVGSNIRVRIAVKALEVLPDLDGIAGRQITWLLTVEREGADKPVCVVESLSRRYWG